MIWYVRKVAIGICVAKRLVSFFRHLCAVLFCSVLCCGRSLFLIRTCFVLVCSAVSPFSYLLYWIHKSISLPRRWLLHVCHQMSQRIYPKHTIIFSFLFLSIIFFLFGLFQSSLPVVIQHGSKCTQLTMNE